MAGKPPAQVTFTYRWPIKKTSASLAQFPRRKQPDQETWPTCYNMGSTFIVVVRFALNKPLPPTKLLEKISRARSLLSKIHHHSHILVHNFLALSEKMPAILHKTWAQKHMNFLIKDAAETKEYCKHFVKILVISSRTCRNNKAEALVQQSTSFSIYL